MKSFQKDYRPPTSRFPATQKRKSLLLPAVMILLFTSVLVGTILIKSKSETLFKIAIKSLPDSMGVIIRPYSPLSESKNYSFSQSLSLVWSEDSSEYWIKCEIENLQGCLNELNLIQPELGRNMFSLINSMVLNPNGGDLYSIQVNFQKGRSFNIPTLSSIWLNVSGNYTNYRISDVMEPWVDKGASDTLFFLGKYCSKRNQCLMDFQDHFLAAVEKIISNCSIQKGCRVIFEDRVPQVSLLGYSNQVLHPFTRGRVTSMNSTEAGKFNVQIYHGHGIYAWYYNLTQITNGMLVGDFLETAQMLGKAEPQSDVKNSFHFKIQFEGALINVNDYCNSENSTGELRI